MILGKAYMAPCTVLQLSPGMLFRLLATISARRARLASTCSNTYIFYRTSKYFS